MIQVFTTGGTIDKVYFDAQSEFEVGDPLVAEILQTAGARVPFTVEVLFRKDSLDISESDREAIAQKIVGADPDRVLVTHGTDTMVQTALTTADALLDATDASGFGKTVVFVGSLTPARFRQTDAEFNVGFAWAAVQTLPPGVYVAMNGRFFDARNVQKNRSRNRFEDTRAAAHAS